MDHAHDEISYDTGNAEIFTTVVPVRRKALKYLPDWPPIDIEFQDLGYTVPDISGNKLLLRNISGKFKSGQLTAILGPSGAGKSTLLNILAGYRTSEATGNVQINGETRDLKLFRKMSRYIMQEDLYQPMLTVKEAMMYSADLKLGKDLTYDQKLDVINEILVLLRLSTVGDTMPHLLSGGERKRLSIALELVNNPSVIFLDEPTTGLDDLASSQCVSLLKRIATGGRTVICSIHTPSAKIFEMFDNVYILANGQCVYQGSGNHIIPYMQSIGLNCPLHHNPADFAIEVSYGEYGNEFIDRMVTMIDNGKCYWTPYLAIESILNPVNTNNNNNNNNNSKMELFEQEIRPEQLKSRSSYLHQFSVLFRRRALQIYRDKYYIKLRVFMVIFLGAIVSGLYQGMGNDATKALFNFGFCFTITIAFLYIPLMPVLLEFPTEVQLLKREHFNHWFGIGPYFLALISIKLPIQILFTFFYITTIYISSEQPLEIGRLMMFYSLSVLMALTSESLALIVASRFSLINGMFIGPVSAVPLMLLSVYGIGYGKDSYTPTYMKFLMSLSYLRHGLEGLIASMYGYNRADTICPDTEVICLFKKADFLRGLLGFADVNFTFSILALCLNYLIFTLVAYYMIKIRISKTPSNLIAVQYVSRFVKRHLNFSSYKY